MTIDTSQNTIKDYVVTDKNGTFNEVRQLQNSNGGIFKSNLYETSFHKGYKWQLEIDTNSSSFYISRYKARNGKFEENGPTYNCDQVVSSQQKKVEIASMIETAKSTCKSLGFKEGSQQFADCSLKLYTQSVELAAEQKKTVVMQPQQNSGSNTMTIYDPVRDSRALMQQGQRMLSGGCTLGINC